jgi:tetratricopeptide (TPR) repeat protein
MCGIPSGRMTAGRWKLVVAAFAMCMLGAAGVSAQTGPRLLVMPFENTTRDARVFWLGEASAVLVTDDLNTLGASAITRDERRAAFQRLQVPPAAVLTDATVIRIGQIVGAARVVVGTLQLEGDTLVIQMRSLAVEAGRIQNSVSERGPISDLFKICERLARSLVPPSPLPSQEIQAAHPPLTAFEQYIKGLLALTPPTAIGYLNAALKIHAGFDRARLALWDVYADQDADDRALQAVQPVPASSPWYREARFRAGLSQLRLKRLDEAFATFKALADARPTAHALNNVGVVQMKRSAMSQGGEPTLYFNKAAEADRTDPDYFFNLGYAYWMARDVQAAIYWLREAVRRDPTDGDAHFVLGAALAAAGHAGEASREKELARRLSSIYMEWEKRPGTDAVPRGLERIKNDVELPRASRVEDALAASGQRDQRGLAEFYLDRGRRLYKQESDRDALAELNRALFLSPYLAEAHLLVGRIHLRGGRFAQAVDALKISIWSSDSAEAHAVLAEAYLGAKDETSARTEAQRALALDPALESARRTLETIDARKTRSR